MNLTEEEDLDIEAVILTTDAQNQLECMEKHKNFSYLTDEYCPAAWDNFFCWPPTSPGAAVFVPCHEIFPFLDADLKQGLAFRVCGVDGLWAFGNWTNYTGCLDLINNQEPTISPITVSYIIFTGSIISLICLGITLFIFSYFKALQCSRIRVHRNLVLSLILHSIMMMIISLPGIFEEIIIPFRDTSWLCKVVITLKMYAAMTCIHWMFVEGLLLHSSITVSVFQQEPPFKIYYTIGWGIPLLCVIIWVILMSCFSTTPCWKGYGKSPFIWFITGPMILSLLVNSVFLINIIRILITKLRMSVSIEIKQIRKAVKATLLLFPLLGITHLLFCINPRDDAHLEYAYMITNSILQSSQGLFVAILYCFLNSEVQSVVMHAYLRSSLQRHTGRSYRRPSSMPSGTATTSLSHSDANGIRAKSSPYRPSTSVVPLKPVPEDSEKNALQVESVKKILLEKETSFIN